MDSIWIVTSCAKIVEIFHTKESAENKAKSMMKGDGWTMVKYPWNNETCFTWEEHPGAKFITIRKHDVTPEMGSTLNGAIRSSLELCSREDRMTKPAANSPFCH